MKTLIFYFVFEIVSLFFMFLAQRSHKRGNETKNINTDRFITKKSTLFLVLSFIPLFILVGFRSINVGVDTENYVNAFLRIANGNILASDTNWLSFGYILLCRLLGIFTKNNYVLLNCLIGFLTLYFVYKAIWQNSKNPTLSLFIFITTCLFYQTFNQSRQMLAIVIVLYSYKYIMNNNFKKYLLCILLAFSIHKSALIMLPFYFLCKPKINKQNMFKYFILILLCTISLPIIKDFISTTSYGLIYERNGLFIATKSSIINLVFRIALFICCLIFNKFSGDKFSNESETKLINIGYWCILFQIIATQIYIFSRMTTYLYVAYILLIPNIYERIKNKQQKQLFLFGVVAVFLIYHLVYFKSVSAASGYDLYSFFFNN